MAKIKKSEMKKSGNKETLLYVIAQEFGDDKEGWEQLAVEMVRAMSDTQAKDILGYIARNWDIDTMGYEASAKKSKVKKSAIKKDARGMLMGRGALEKFKDLIQTIKSEEGIDFGDDAGFDTLLEFYMNCIEEYNVMVNGEGPQFYASTKKSKTIKKSWPQHSESYSRMWEKYVPDNGEADTEFGEMLRCASRVIYRFYNDGDMYRIGYGTETVNPYLTYLKRCKYYEIKRIANEIARFVQDNMSTLKWELKLGYDGEHSMQNGYDALLNELAQEVDKLCQIKEAEDSKAESEEALYYASTKKSNNIEMSFEQNVNKMRVNNYAKIGNINTVMKKRD